MPFGARGTDCLGLGGWWDEEDDFAFGFSLGKVGLEFGAGSVVEGLEGFGELAGDADFGVGRELGEDFESGGNPVGGFKEEGGLGGVESGLELLAAFAFFDGEEAVEGKGMRWKT